MYEKSFSEKIKTENLPKTKEEKLNIGFDQTITEDMKVAYDENITEYLQKSPMLETFQCFKDYNNYTGEVI
jgi:hypothetical protein